jgi:DNA polymerase III subunit beta
MKFSVLAENLKKDLMIVLRGISNKPQMPILSGILMRVVDARLELTTTDLSISFWSSMPVKMESEGEMVVPGKLFVDLVNSIGSGMVSLESDGGVLKVVSSSVTAEIVGQEADDYPAIPRVEHVNMIIDGNVYERSVERVSVVASRDDLRPILTGMLWKVRGDDLDWVATDGYRLAVDRVPAKIEKAFDQIIVPVRSLNEVLKIWSENDGEIRISVDVESAQVLFVVGGVEIGTRVLSGEFPPYQQIIPNTYNHRITCARQDFLDAVKRGKLFAKDSSNVIRVSVEDSEIVVLAEGGQMGKSESRIGANVEGEALNVAFNASYLQDFLVSVSDETLVWETEGDLKPSVFRVADEEFRQIIMPVRV